MPEQELEEEVEVEVEEEKKPSMVFDEEFEIITDDAELIPDEPDEDEDVEPPEDPTAAAIGRALGAQRSESDDKLAMVLENIQKTMAPKTEPVAPTDWDAEAAKIAEKLTEDPKEAVKDLTALINRNVGGALQYQQGQILDTQKQASKIIARGDENLKVVFDNWGAEVDEIAKTIPITTNEEAGTAYTRAAQQVMMTHLADVIALKAEEIAKGRNSASVKRSKVATKGAPAVEGQRPAATYKFTPADKAWAEKHSMGSKAAFKYLINKGRAIKVR